MNNNHVTYVKSHKKEFSEYIFGDKNHYLELNVSIFLTYMMKYGKEFMVHSNRVKAINNLLNEV